MAKMTGDGTTPPDKKVDRGQQAPAEVGQLPAALSRLAAEQSPVGMVLLDVDHRIRWTNAGFRALLEAPDLDPLGASISDFITRPAFLTPDDEASPGPLGSDWQQLRLGPAGRLVLVSATPAVDRGPDDLRLLTFVDSQEAPAAGATRPPPLFHDSLNRLASVWLFEDRFRHAMERARRPDQEVALLLVRLDHREALLGRLGPEALESVVSQVERRLAQTLRREDSLSRLGDGCWGALIEHPLSPEGLQTAALRCLEAMDAPFRVQGRSQLLTLSIGIAIAPEDGDSAEQLLGCAEVALEQAGPSRHAFFDEGLKRRLCRDLAFRQELQEALLEPDRHFRVYFQPLVDLRSGRCVGLEALVRWQHPVHGLLVPGRFLPMVAELGQQVRLDRWVIASVIAQHARWREQGSWLAELGVAVNAEVGLLDQATFDRRPLDVFLRQQALEPGWLTVELAQQDLVAQSKAQVHLLRRLSALGVQLVVNDVGAAPLDLLGLASLPVSRVKLSHRLSAALVPGSPERPALAALLHCLGVLELEAVLVGIETREQLEAAVGMGITLAQGHRLGEPQPPETLEGWQERRAAPR